MRIPRCFLSAALLAVIMFGFTACSKPEPLHSKPIHITSSEELAAWTTTVAKEVTPAEMQEFNDSINSIRLGIMNRKEASGEANISRVLCERIDGKTFYQVIALGYQTEIEWVSNELALQRKNVDATNTALAGPGSDTAKEPLRDYLAIATKNIEKLEARLAKAQAGLAAVEKR